jgi:RimJ/RimL family protein N-acetyltransferase
MEVKPAPTISTARLVLRPLTRSSQRQIDWLNDREIVRYSEQRHDKHTLSSQLRFIMSFAGRSRIWAITLLEGGEHIGNLSGTFDEPNSVCDVGILIGDRKCWGKGYGREAWNAACNWLMQQEGARKLEAGCMRANEAMVKIIRSSGFREEGERHNHFLLNGAPVGMLLFGRSK